MDLDAILATVREKRALAEQQPPGHWERLELCDLVEQLVARVREREAPPAGTLEKRSDAFVDDVQAGGRGMSFDETCQRYPEAMARTLRGLAERAGEADALSYAQALVSDPDGPEPGKMRVTASLPVAYDVSPQQIAAYLRSKGWVESAINGAARYERNGDLIAVEHPESASWHKCFAFSLGIVARIEGRATGEVLRDIAGMEEA